MEFKEFEGTTYQEWLDYHYKISYKEIVKAMIEKQPHLMRINFLKKEGALST